MRLRTLLLAAAFVAVPVGAFAQTSTPTPTQTPTVTLTVTKTYTPSPTAALTRTPTAPKNDESTDVHALQMDDYANGPYPTPKRTPKCILYFQGGQLHSICPGGTPVAY